MAETLAFMAKVIQEIRNSEYGIRDIIFECAGDEVVLDFGMAQHFATYSVSNNIMNEQKINYTGATRLTENLKFKPLNFVLH